MTRDKNNKVVYNEQGEGTEVEEKDWIPPFIAMAVNGYLKHMQGVFQLSALTSHDVGVEIHEWALSFRNFAFSELCYQYCVSLLRQGKNFILRDSHDAVKRYRRDIYEIITDSDSWCEDGISKLREEVTFLITTKIG